ncbi:MAG: hypothetical protein KC646_01590 [Candidatus Cloacimonetes bacterium]|nr:hypothetical protein [Candidatus Cloacimonadota bacterium]
MFFLKRSTVLIFTIFYLFSVVFPALSFAGEEVGSIDPDRLEAIIQGQKESSRLAKQSQKELEDMIENDYNMSLNFLAYRGAKVLAEAYLKEVSSAFNLQKQSGGVQAEFNLRMGAKIFNRLSSAQKTELMQKVKSVGYDHTMQMFFGMVLLHKDYLGGSNWWEERKDDGNALQRMMKIDNVDGLGAGNIGAISFIAAMYNARVYSRPARGVDKTTFEKNIMAFSPYYDANGKEACNLSNVKDANHSILFNGKYSNFKKILMADATFLQMLGIALHNPKSKGSKTILEKLGYHGSYYGKKAGIKMSTVILEEITMGALEDAAESAPHSSYKGKFGRLGSTVKRAGETGKNLLKISKLRHGFAQALKWVSRSEITHHVAHHAKDALTGAGLGALVKHTVTGTAFGILAEALVESAIVLAVGQRKDEVQIGKESFQYRTQRTSGQNDNKGYWQDRKFAFLDVMDDYADNKEAKIAGSVGGAVAIALMGVSLPAVLVAAAVGYAAYAGVKAIMYTETVQNWKNSSLIKRLLNMMKKMPTISSKHNEDKLEEMAEARARDMMKRKKYAKQSLQRMYMVDHLESVSFYEKRDFWWFKTESEKTGDVFDDEAHARYDIIDVYGKRGVYDVVSNNRLVMVGSIKKVGGLDVQIIQSDPTFNFKDGELRSLKGSNFRILSNGTVMTKRDDDKDKWMIRALVSNTDLAFRDGKGSYHYDPDKKAYVKKDKSYLVIPKSENTSEDSTQEASQNVSSSASTSESPCPSPLMSCVQQSDQNSSNPIDTAVNPLDVMSMDLMQSNEDGSVE